MTQDNLPAETTKSTVNPEYDELDDDGLVDLETTTLQRDDDGELLPVRTFVQELGGDVVAKPLERDERERFVEDLIGDSGKDELTDAELAELFDSKIVAPDLSEHRLCEEGRVTERFVRKGLNQNQEDGYYIAVLLASDEDELVRRLRGEFKESELELAKAAMGTDGDDGPQGNGPTAR